MVISHFLCLSACLSVSLFIYLSLCLSVSLSVCLSVCLSICLSIYVSIYLAIYVYIDIYIHTYIVIHTHSLYHFPKKISVYFFFNKIRSYIASKLSIWGHFDNIFSFLFLRCTKFLMLNLILTG